MTTSLSEWLSPLADLPLECDGLTRVISMLMSRDCIAHKIGIGQLRVEGAGSTPLHWWIILPDGQHCDFRARMWLGDTPDVPHGVFTPDVQHQYKAMTIHEPASIAVPPVVFTVLSGFGIDHHPAFQTDSSPEFMP